MDQTILERLNSSNIDSKDACLASRVAMHWCTVSSRTARGRRIIQTSTLVGKIKRPKHSDIAGITAETF